ncbi:MAG: protein kinase [Phycisphaerales bacterium JB039]
MTDQIGPYRIQREIGRGGMGVVYLAHDERLDRDVAIKALPAELAEDAARLERFEREAKTLAQLNHPNVAGIYGVEEQDGQKYLILEYVEGETLGDRLDRGPIPVDEALELAIAIAAGVEAAHEAGVIHRDLKPDNIKITPEGKVKILDFGLARRAASTASAIEATDSPTVMGASPTIPGAILGTAAYMSPEQARGRHVDKRTDIWSFGVILYEMLTGASPFAGETATDSIGAVLHKVIDLDALPAETPDGVRRVILRCLARDRDKRLHSIADGRIELSEPVETGAPGAAVAVQGARRGAPRYSAVAAAALLLGGVGGALVVVSTQQQADDSVRRYELRRDPSLRPETGHIISPDGRFTAYVQGGSLWIRERSSFDARLIPETEGATQPFWSPDSAHVGFAQGDRLRKVALAGGGATTICKGPGEFSEASGAAWLDDGTIIFTTGNSGLYAAPASGGQPELWLAPDPETELDFHEVSALPDGKGVIFVVHPINDNWYIGASDGARRAVVARFGSASSSSPCYGRSGHVLFTNTGEDRGLWAVPFDVDRLEATGDPMLIDASGGAPSISDRGDLMYVRGINSGLRLAWQDADGASEPIGEAHNLLLFPALSPDGRRIAVSGYAEDNLDVWIHDIETGARRHLTFDPAREGVVGWTDDGQRIAVATMTPGSLSTRFVSVADGSPVGAPVDGLMYDWVEDEDGWIGVVQRASDNGDLDLWAAPLEGGGAPTPLAQSPGRDAFGRLSPDRRWLAYESDRTGRTEIFLTRFPSGEGIWQVSSDGGQNVIWSADGSRLYFLADNLQHYMSVSIKADPDLQIGSPQPTPWKTEVASTLTMGADLSADGKLLYIQAVTAFDELSIAVVENWFREISK